MKKAPPQKDRFDLNEAINEVIVLARGAITKNGVSVETRMMEGPFPVAGDRVQLQQVSLRSQMLDSVLRQRDHVKLSPGRDTTGPFAHVRKA
jgi:C4-dicarboxylate-specific signal transduction histidine kinase